MNNQTIKPNSKEKKDEVKNTESDVLHKQIQDLNNQLTEANQAKLRTLADYQNLVKRVEKEKQDWVKFASEGLLLRLLDIVDNFDRAAIFVHDKGLQMIHGQLRQMLTEYGVKEIEVLGKEFDPSFMECLDKAKGEPNKVVETKQKGYMLHDKVLRPAKVVVGQ